MPGGRHRSPLLALLALAIPLPALALSSGDGAGSIPAPAPLSVATSLDSCGIAETQVVCKLDVSFNAIPGATSYTASVTRADGSVVDYGEVGAGGGPLWVPYTGSGSYSVRVSAYGTPPAAESGDAEERGNELITSEATEGTNVEPDAAGNAKPDENPGAREGQGDDHQADGRNAANDHDPGAEPGAAASSESSCEIDLAPAPAPGEEPPELPPADLDPADADEDDDGIDDAEERAAFERAVIKGWLDAFAAQAALSDAVACGERVSP